MPLIKNVSPYGALDVPLLGVFVEAGEVVEVTAAQSGVLLEQAENFVSADPERAPEDPPEDPPAPPANPESEQS